MKIKLKDIEEYNSILNANDVDIIKKLPSKADLIDPTAFDYDENKAVVSPLGGSMPKTFVRCDSKYFKELIEELKKPNCSYVTYINDLVKSLNSDNIENFPLSKISVLIKKSHRAQDIYNEEIASKTANILEIPVTYNTVVNIAGIDYNMSVDFLKKDEEFISLDHCKLNDAMSFCVIKKKLQKYFEYYVACGEITQEQAYNLLSDFMEMYIFRKYILSDTDFDMFNTGLIFNNKTKEYKWAPNFDMEYMENFKIDKSALQVDMMFMRNFNSEKLHQIIEKYRQKIRFDNKDNKKSDRETSQRLRILVDTYDLMLNQEISKNI